MLLFKCRGQAILPPAFFSENGSSHEETCYTGYSKGLLIFPSVNSLFYECFIKRKNEHSLTPYFRC